MYIKEIIDMINKERNRRIRLENAGKFVIGASIGAAFGVLAGLLFAPKPGKETRRDLADTAGNLSRSVAQKVGEAGKTMERAKESSKNIIKNVVKKAGKINVDADPAKDTEIVIEPDADETIVKIELVNETGEENLEEGTLEGEYADEENAEEESTEEEIAGEDNTGEDNTET